MDHPGKDAHRIFVFVGHDIGIGVRIWEFYKVQFETVELENTALISN